MKVRRIIFLCLLFYVIISGCSKDRSVSISPPLPEAWTIQQTPTDQTLKGIYFVDLNNGWAVGDFGTILFTTDGGKSWSAQASGITFELCDVKFCGLSYGWTVGASGIILRTTDGGKTWKDESDPQATTARLWRCSFPDTLNGWVAGEDGTIIHTTDGGKSWLKQTLPEGSENWWLKAIFFADSTEGWACGKEGIILHTVDGGDNWARQWEGGTTMNLNGVIFPENKLEGWAVGKWGEILHTIDGGTNWEKQVEGGAQWQGNRILECLKGGVCFVDNLHGWGVGKYGRIVSTHDGGKFTYYDDKERPTYGDYPGPGWVVEVDRGSPQYDLWDLHAVKSSGKLYVWTVGDRGRILCCKVVP